MASRLVDEQSRREKEEVESAARAAFAGQGVARGHLSATPFPEVLAQLYRWRSTGGLLLRRDRVKKIVFLRGGYPILVKSNLLSECLGKVMTRERLISEADCETSIRKMRETGRQQGTLLIEMGAISPHNLAYALQLQLETKLYEVFSWTGGEYQFNPAMDVPNATVQLDHSPAALILEGIKRTWSTERIKQHLARHLDSPVGPHPDPLQRLQELSLTEREATFAAMFDGRRSLRDVLEHSPLTPLQSLWLAYGLLAAQVCQFVVPGASSSVPPPLPGPAQAAGAPPPLPSGPPSLKKAQERRSTAPAIPVAPPPVMPAPARTTTSPAGVMGTADRGRVEVLARRVKDMRKMNYFEMLGIAKTASQDEVRKAYFSQAKDYHPDKHFGSGSAEVKALADQVYSMLSTAYETLADTREREEYARALRSPAKSGVSDEVTRILAAEARFQRGEQLLRRKDYAGAQAAFAEAIALYPDEGEFHCSLGWALFLGHADEPAQVSAAEAHLGKGLQLAPRLDRGHVQLGHVYRHTGRKELAAQQFEKAIQCNPDSSEALKELKLLRAARPAPTTSGKSRRVH